MNTILVIAGISAAVFFGIVIIFFLLLVFLMFYNTTYRSPLKKRTRECTRKKDESQMRMFAESAAWPEKFRDKKTELCIVSTDGLYLYGEYINFGYEKCAVILQGRGESLLYSYYFADVYAKNGYNILVFDLRSYGLSDGKYQTGGIKESDDIILWIKMINEKFNIADFTIHGICIGGAAAIYAYCKLKAEGNNLIKRIVTDGLYKSYYELFKAHMKVYKVPFTYPAIYMLFFLIFILTKVRLFRETPIKCMKDIGIPILFIWSAMDKFSAKQNSEELFEACVSEHKEICFFPKGRHSHVRASQKEEYDELIAKFLEKHK